MMGNKAYCANRQLVNSSLISRSSKLQIYRTFVVRPVVTYGSESWTLTMEEVRALKENSAKNIWTSERKRIMENSRKR